MSERRSRKLFVNLAVRDLKKSMAFFSVLSFSLEPKFTDDKAACLHKACVCDTTKQTEAFLAIDCTSREEVDALVKAASPRAAARPPMPTITGSCTVGASTTSTGTTGRSSGWIRKRP
jgi:uncharacterized protein